jgi:hypothetical protein
VVCPDIPEREEHYAHYVIENIAYNCLRHFRSSKSLQLCESCCIADSKVIAGPHFGIVIAIRTSVAALTFWPFDNSDCCVLAIHPARLSPTRWPSGFGGRPLGRGAPSCETFGLLSARLNTSRSSISTYSGLRLSATYAIFQRAHCRRMMARRAPRRAWPNCSSLTVAFAADGREDNAPVEYGIGARTCLRGDIGIPRSGVKCPPPQRPKHKARMREICLWSPTVFGRRFCALPLFTPPRFSAFRHNSSPTTSSSARAHPKTRRERRRA